MNLLRALVIGIPLLAIACSASPQRGPGAVRIDPGFSASQREDIYSAVDEWNVAAGLTVAISPWNDVSAIPIERNDALVSVPELGHLQGCTDKIAVCDVQLPGSGAFIDGSTVSSYDFQTMAAHELGHLYGLRIGGCDDEGHSCNPDDLMYFMGNAGDPRRTPSAEDVQRVDAAVEKVW